mgnify:CR=1 FL=1
MSAHDNILDFIKRTDKPTANPYAERALLGGLLVHRDKYGAEKTAAFCAEQQIDPDLFVGQTYRELFTAITDLLTRGESPDLAALVQQMTSQAVQIEFESLRTEFVSDANLAAFARQLKECRQQRAIAAAQSALAVAAESGRPAHELQALLEALESAKEGQLHSAAIPPPFRRFTPAELETARLSPKCIVDKYLYADLALVAAAGGTGKTTALIYEAVCIATGRDLWGKRVINPGKTLFITAEDSRDLFAARLREVIAAMNLTEYERRIALDAIAVWDVSANLVRLAELDKSGNIRLTGLADQIIHAYRNEGLAQIVFDPAISFSPGERMVNDGEQSIVTACRRIIRGLGCCVRLVHHTGKVNARNGAMDQYASRGGTALPDGCRMVTVMCSVSDDPELLNMGGAPEGFHLDPGDSGFILAQGKLSYAPPQPKIWVRRRGFAFEHFSEQPKLSKENQSSLDADRLVEFLADELLHFRRYTKNDLEQVAGDKLNLSRSRLRSALVTLEINGRVVSRDLPDDEKQGGRKTYLHPFQKSRPYLAAPDGEVGEKTADFSAAEAPTSPSLTSPPPYREYNGGEVEPPFNSPDSLNLAANNGEVAAKWRSKGKPVDAGDPDAAWKAEKKRYLESGEAERHIDPVTGVIDPDFTPIWLQMKNAVNRQKEALRNNPSVDAIDIALARAATAKPQSRKDLARIAGHPKLPDLDQRIGRLLAAGYLAPLSGGLVAGGAA